ncbi:MAG TPA: hypothetical protein VLB85_07300 [Acidimicrobiia bacterium]|nr:hypothetical protein [Acidimicrobiia bacterium]
MSKQSSDSPGSSLPVLALTGLGILITVLGLFAAGDMAIVVIGLAAIFGAGVIGVIERLIEGRRVQPDDEHERAET